MPFSVSPGIPGLARKRKKRRRAPLRNGRQRAGLQDGWPVRVKSPTVGHEMRRLTDGGGSKHSEPPHEGRTPTQRGLRWAGYPGGHSTACRADKLAGRIGSCDSVVGGQIVCHCRGESPNIKRCQKLRVVRISY